jgi:hypothetical protein
VEWIILSRSRWNSERVGLGPAPYSLPKEASGLLA